MTSIDVLNDQFAEARKDYEETKKGIAEKGKKLIHKMAKAIFDDDPDLVRFSWDQYTPYFNDGDACIFGLREPNITWWKDNVTAEDREDDYTDDEELLIEEEYAYGSFTAIGEGYEGGGLPEKCRKSYDAILQLHGFLESNSELALDIFDDHVTVTALRGGIETKECSHD